MALGEKLRLVGLITAVVGIVIAISFITALALTPPVRVEVGGALYPLVGGKWYIFKGRETPTEPVIEVWVMLPANRSAWTRAWVEVRNWLSTNVNGHVELVFYDAGGHEIGEGEGLASVAARSRVRLILSLSWAEGAGPGDAVWARLRAVFTGWRGVPTPWASLI